MTRISASLSLTAACAAAFAAFTPAFAGEPLDGYELMLVPDRTVLTPANPTATVTVMGGWFGEDAQFGVAGFHGDITAGEPALTLVGAAFPIFFELPQSGEGSTDVLLNEVDWFRNLVPATQENPGGPPPYGADELVPIGTFTFTVADFTSQRSVMIEASGASPVIAMWYCACGGLVAWVPVIDQDSLQSATASTWLIVVPAPGAAAPLVAAGVFAFSHRRSRSAP